MSWECHGRVVGLSRACIVEVCCGRVPSLVDAAVVQLPQDVREDRLAYGHGAQHLAWPCPRVPPAGEGRRACERLEHLWLERLEAEYANLSIQSTA